jgi:hypothetical protein
VSNRGIGNGKRGHIAAEVIPHFVPEHPQRLILGGFARSGAAKLELLSVPVAVLDQPQHGSHRLYQNIPLAAPLVRSRSSH